MTAVFGDDLSGFGADAVAAAAHMESLLGQWDLFSFSSSDAIRNVRNTDTALAQLVSSGNVQGAELAFARLADEAGRNGVSHGELIELFPQYSAALGGVAVAAHGAAVEVERLTEDQLIAIMRDNDHRTATDLLAGALNDQRTSLGDVYRAQRALTDLRSSSRTTEREYEQAVDDATAALRENGGTLDLNTQQGRNNDRALADLIGTGRDHIQSLADQGVGADTLRGKEENLRQKVFDLAEAHGINRGEVARLLAEYGLLGSAISGLPDGHFVVRAEGRMAINPQGGFQEFAVGGRVRGPGTGTSDDIVARVSNGEWVVREKVSRDQGYAAMDALNRGQADIVPRARAEHLALKGSILRSNPREHPVGGYAGGGEIGSDGVPRFRRGGAIQRAGIDPRDMAQLVWRRLSDAAANQMTPIIQRRLRELESGALMGGGSGPGGWQWQMRVLRAVFPGLQLISGFRRGSITRSGNLSYHARGRAVDVPPRIAVFNWLRSRYGSNTRELIYSPANNRQIHNGRNHYYTGGVRGDHWDHVHWAYDRGGLLSGRGDFRKDTLQPERVLSPRQTVSFERLVNTMETPRPRNVPVGAEDNIGRMIASAITRGFAENSFGANIDVTVNNPIRERSSDTVQRELSRMSELGMFE